MMARREVYVCPTHERARGPRLPAKQSRFALALRKVQNPLWVIEMVGLLALAMSVMTLIMTHG